MQGRGASEEIREERLAGRSSRFFGTSIISPEFFASKKGL
jgi:hypothetical protein